MTPDPPTRTGTAPAPRQPPPERPDDPSPTPSPGHVAAARARRRIPFWAMATLSLMPVWGFMYVRALTEPAATSTGPIGLGAEIYNQCASCHGADGGGANGYKLADGEVLLTFPRIEDQIRYVYYGTDNYRAARIDIYGNHNRPGGPHLTGAKGPMPAFGPQLTQTEIISVVCHERYTLAGADPTGDTYRDEYELWCNDTAPVYQAVQAGEYDITSTGVEPFDPDQIISVGPQPSTGTSD